MNSVVAVRVRTPHLTAAVPWLALTAGVATIAVGLFSGIPLGVSHPPFVGHVAPHADPLLAVSIACFTAAVVLAPRLLTLPAWGFACASFVLTLILRLALAAGGGGAGGAGIAAWWKVFDPARSYEAPNEYLPALGALHWGPRFFLDRFAETVPALPVHAAGHPPGLLLTLHFLGVTSPGGMAALCIGVGALGVPLLYALARGLVPEHPARVATLLLAFAPGALLFGATSADAVYLTLGLLAAWPLTSRSWVIRAVGAAALAVASLFAWSLLAVGAWAALIVWRRDGLRTAALLSALCALCLLAFYAALYAATGFDPIGTLTATGDVYRAGVAASRPYWFWLFGSPTAFLVVLGLPITWYALRTLEAGHTLAISIFFVLALSAILGFTKAETERIWLFFAPFVCLAAAERSLPLRPLLAALAVQALAWELVFDTIW
jgi:methylthioxylose transferase